MGNHLEGSDLKVSALKIKSQGLLSNNYWLVNYIENQNVLRTTPSTERNYVTYIHPPMHTYIHTYICQVISSDCDTFLLFSFA